MRPQGTLILKSSYKGEMSANFSSVVVDEIKIIGSRCGPFGPALRLMEARQVDPTILITADYRLGEALKAFEHAAVEAMDPNGSIDILEVYFKVYKPDGTTNNFKWLLLDDGSCCPIPPFNQVSGDLIANDGIYSRKIEVDQTNDKGTYRFEFQAKDRLGILSNILNHFVLIQ